MLFGLVLVSAVVVGAAGCTSKTAKIDPAKRVVVLALDAGTWDLLDGYIERGLLPNIKRLRDGGAWGPLESINPSSSPVIWTSVATGKTPEQHGITFFVRFPDGKTGNPVPVSRSLRKTKAIWNILGDADKDVAVVGWLITWPAEEVYGRLISDRAHYGDLKDESFPPNYMAQLKPIGTDTVLAAMPSFMEMTFDPAKVDRNATDPEGRINYLVYDRFVRAYARDVFYMEALERTLDDGALPDVLFMYLRGTDDVQHGFWKFMEPELFEGVSEAQAEAFGRVIERYWGWTDFQVGQILERFGQDRLVMVLSDHGAGAAVGKNKVVTKEYMHLSGSHRKNGMVILNGPGVQPGTKLEGASIYDVTPTLLAYLGLPLAEDMNGRVLGEAFTACKNGCTFEHIASYETGLGEGGGLGEAGGENTTSPMDEKVLEGLRSLGYIDDSAGGAP